MTFPKYVFISGNIQELEDNWHMIFKDNTKRCTSEQILKAAEGFLFLKKSDFRKLGLLENGDTTVLGKKVCSSRKSLKRFTSLRDSRTFLRVFYFLPWLFFSVTLWLFCHYLKTPYISNILIESRWNMAID